MTDFFSIAIVPLLLTLAAYRAGLFLRQKTKTPMANPILIAVILVLLVMKFTGLTLEDYQSGMGLISWLMTPATVCLAIPMYEHLQILKKNLPAMLAGIAAGAISCLFTVLGICLLCRFEPSLTYSLLPKSVTSAIGVPLTQMYDGLPSVTTAVIILTGILASILGSWWCRILRLTDPVARGVAFGTAGHVIGTARAAELDPVTGAASSLALVVAGLLTSLVFPIAAALV
jgi:putative effector of murein hydrolase